jgi:hypothetical protein
MIGTHWDCHFSYLWLKTPNIMWNEIKLIPNVSLTALNSKTEK